MDTKPQIHAGFSEGSSSELNGLMCTWGFTKLSRPINIRSNVFFISTELVFTQMFFGVVHVFAYSLDVSDRVAVVSLCELGQTHADSPQSLLPFFLFLYCTGMWREQLLLKLLITSLMEVIKICLISDNFYIQQCAIYIYCIYC